MTEFEEVLETILEEYARRDSEGEFDTWEETDAFINEKAKVLLAYTKEEPVSEELEGYLKQFCLEYYNYDYPKQYIEGTGSSIMPHIIEAAHYFAGWQKQQMMREAVEATCLMLPYPDLFKVLSCYDITNKLKHNEKVKLIVINND